MTTAERRGGERELLDEHRRALSAAGGPDLDRDLPLPTKIVTEVLAPTDVDAKFGKDPDPAVSTRTSAKRCSQAWTGSPRSAGFRASVNARRRLAASRRRPL